MQTTQVQLKISLSEQLNDLLLGKAQRLGIPLTQYVKHIIVKEVEKEKIEGVQRTHGFAGLIDPAPARTEGAVPGALTRGRFRLVYIKRCERR